MWWARVPAALRASKTLCCTTLPSTPPSTPTTTKGSGRRRRRGGWTCTYSFAALLPCVAPPTQPSTRLRAHAPTNLQMSTLAPSPRSHKGASARQHAHPAADMARLRQRPPTPMGKVAPWLGQRPPTPMGKAAPRPLWPKAPTFTEAVGPHQPEIRISTLPQLDLLSPFSPRRQAAQLLSTSRSPLRWPRRICRRRERR